MKKLKVLTIAIVLTLVAFGSCKSPNDSTVDIQSTEISSDEKQIIKKAISDRIEEIIKGSKELNVDAALKPYSSDADFRIVYPDASVIDFQTLKNVETESFKRLASLNFRTIKQDFTFLTKNLVICTWTSRNELERKDIEKTKMIIEPYVKTMIFRKNDNEWKIVYVHETTAVPYTVPVTIESKK